MQLVLNTHGLSFKVKNGLFRVSAGEEVRDISPELIDSIAITSGCVLSSGAIQLAAEAEIPIYIFDRYGDANACLRSPYFESLATLRRKQVYFSDRKEGAAWVVRQFELKTEGQVKTLAFLADRCPGHKKEILEVIHSLEEAVGKLRTKHLKVPSSDWSSGIMGWEGYQAKQYWQVIGKSLGEPWGFEARSRRPAQDAYNSLTNYFYGMLYAMTEQALFAAGLDPHLGILHVDEYDRPTLSYDLIEPFRPWVDHFILHQILREGISTAQVEKTESGYWLSSAGKQQLIPAFNEWMLTPVRWEKKQAKRQGQIFRHAAELARLIDHSMKRPNS